MKRFQRIYSVLFSVCLFVFSVYALLDSFVISRVYAVVETEAADTLSAQAADNDSVVSAKRLSRHSSGKSRTKTDSTASMTQTVPVSSSESDNTGNDPQIQISEYRVNDTTVYVADIQLNEASGLKTAFSQNSYGRNVTADTSDTAAATGAVLAINGDNYGSREKGYVIRNGVLYRDTAAKDQEDLVIYSDGSFEIVKESEITAQELLENGAVQVFSFGPGLLENGTVTVSANEEVDRAKTSNPRTAVGILGENHYVFVVSDGRTDESEGLTLYELAEFMKELGVETAYNLDGGGSSTMVYQGTVVNNPTSGRSIDERAVTDIIYV